MNNNEIIMINYNVSNTIERFQLVKREYECIADI